MKSKSITDLPGLPDAFSDAAEAEAFTFVPASVSQSSATSQTSTTNVGPQLYGALAPTEEYTESVQSVSSSTAGTTVAVTNGGMTFDLTFDVGAPASFMTGIEQAASMLSAALSDKITVNLNIHYTGTGGGAFAGPSTGLYENYSTIRSDLINQASPGDTTFNALQNTSGQSLVAVWNSQLKALGLLSPTNSATDGSATFATDIDPSLLIGVALHELTHALGRVPYGSAPDIFDLYRFTSPGAQLFTGGNTAVASYFSVDGGNTDLADFGLHSDPSDFLNSGPTFLGGPYSTLTPGDPFNELYGSGTLQSLTAVDKKLLDALGFHAMTPVTTVIEALGSTSLVQVGSNFYLDSVATGTGPQLKYGAAAVTAGQFGGYAPIGVEQTSTGYEVAWKMAGADLYSVWSTDSSGNYTGNLYMPGSGSSATLEALETSFHQDLNGDGVIGVPPITGTVIEALGSTSLIQHGQNFYLDNISTSTGPTLKYGGTPVVAGQFGGYAPIGVEQTSTGYEVAWKMAGADLYSVWSTDSSGNYTGNLYMPGSGSSATLEALETSFHQDLNGDGVIGVPPITGTVIESLGSTSLVQHGQNFYLDNISTNTGPTLKYGGTPVVAGQFGGYAPIGVEQTSTGYEVAWKMAGADLYSVWSTDSSGNYTGNLYMPGPGSNATLEALETSFHQDLNGDGVIGVNGSVSSGVVLTTSVSQQDWLSSANNDTFNFRSGPGAEVMPHASGMETSEQVGFPTGGSSLSQAANEAQMAIPTELLHWSVGDPSVIGVHESAHLVGLQAGNFIIG